MELNTRKKHLVHVLPHRRQRAPRKRTVSLDYEEVPCISNVQINSKPFTFPAPPQKPYRPLSENISYICESDSDSQSDTSGCQYHGISSPLPCVHPRVRCQGYQSEGSPVPLHTVPRLLPPIGVFWDIENCQVPKGRSAVAVAQVIRKRFFTGYREAEFLVVCDVKKESNQILQELNDAQVNLIHVASMCKNAADEKLRQSMRRFADIHGSPASIVLISGDINFAADITDLRHRKKINVILLHMENTSENLILCASEHYSFTDLVESLPPRGAIKQSSQPVEVIVYNLPAEKDNSSVRTRLRQLSDNCGGRVTTLKHTCATIRFTSFDIASRAQKRMDGEDVFGRKIQVSHPVRVTEKEGSPQKNHNGKKYQTNGGRENMSGWTDSSIPVAPNIYHCAPSTFSLLGPNINQHPCVGNWSVYGSTSTSVNVAQEYFTGTCTGFHTSLDVSANSLPFSAFGGQNSSCLFPRNPPTEVVNIPCEVLDKVPKGLRQIRGTHKGFMPLETGSSEIEVNQKVANSLQSRSHSGRALVKAGPSDVPSQVQTLGSRNSSPFATMTDISNSMKRSSSKGRAAGPSRTPTPGMQQYDGDLDEPEHFFHPITSSDLSNVNGSSSNEPVELHVSNLDQTFGAREMKKILLSAFKEHVMEMEVLEPPLCPMHGHEVQPNRGWAEQEVLSLPSVNISLKLLSVRVHALLQTHNGSLHLNSFPQCYHAQFGTLEENKDGVALEHLVSCLPGIEIFNSPANVKYLKWSKTRSVSSCSSKTDEEMAKTNASLAGKLTVFSREMVDLLKTSPRCQVLFDKFIPAYHHHFGRQCRVADYGFTKLIELLESLPHTVQVLGEGNRRMVTLSHRVQIRRFMGDLLRVLRGQVNKQVLLSELPDAFERVFNKPLVVSSYGVCDVLDLLSDLPDSSVVVTPVQETGEDMLIAIPKREQTTEEIEKTKQFAAEVVELLRHVPNCTMRFNKFIPAHHIHFGWQCRVADYGFTKLIELFEAIPDIVKIVNVDGERWVSLTKKEHLKVLADQIASLLQSAPQSLIDITALNNYFRIQFGYSLRPDAFDCSTIEELLALLLDTIQVTEMEGKLIVSLGSAYVQQQFIQDIQNLVLEAGGSLPLSSVESKFLQKYGRPCHPTQFGFSSLGALLQNLRGAVRLRGRGTRRSVVLSDPALTPAAGTTLYGTSVDKTAPSNTPSCMSSTAISVSDFQGDSSSTNEGDSGHDDASSTSAVDVDSSLSSGSKVHSSERSSGSEVLSDIGTSLNGCDPVGHMKKRTPGKGPWSNRILPQLCETDSPAVMLSPSSNLLPAFSSQKTSSSLVMCHLPPLYSYPPFLPGHVASPEPSTLPLPQLGLTAPLFASQEVQPASSVNDSSNSSTPNKTKVKRRLAAQFHTPLDLP